MFKVKTDGLCRKTRAVFVFAGDGSLGVTMALMIRDKFLRAAEAIQGARAILVTAGTGMGVDSGLPDFRGPKGFWAAYPAYRHLGLGFSQLPTRRASNAILISHGVSMGID